MGTKGSKAAKSEAATLAIAEKFAADTAADKAAPSDKAATDKAAADKTAADKKAADKKAADKKAADKAGKAAAAAEKAAAKAEKAAEKAAAAEKTVATEKAAADKAAADEKAAAAAAPVKAAAEAPKAAAADTATADKPKDDEKRSSKKHGSKRASKKGRNSKRASKKKADPYFDLIINKDLKKNEYPEEIITKAKAAEHTSLMAQVMTKEIFDKYKDMVSTGPAKWTIARAINSGTMYPESFVGCHAGDYESWDDFHDLFYPVIKLYHAGFDPENPPPLDPEHMNPDKITVDLTDSAKAKIISTRIRCARNLSMFPLNPGGTKETRLEIADLMEKVYATLEGDFSGKFLRHSTMSDEEREQLVSDHFLFRGKDKMQAASGYHEHWPAGRGVYLNKDKAFVNWINEGDHLRIIAMEQGADVRGVFARMAEGARLIEEAVKKVTGVEKAFMMHPKFGAIACCPSNLGTGMRGSVHILVPKLIEVKGFKWIDSVARKRNCQARGSSGEHSEVVDRIDLSNWRRIGFPEYQLVQDMIHVANLMSVWEDKAVAGEDVPDEIE